MENLSLLELAAAGLVVMVAFGVRGTTGFGGQAIAVPLLTLVLPLPVVVPAMTALVVLSSLAHWLRDWRSIVWREIARLAPFTLAGVLIGLYVFQALMRVAGYAHLGFYDRATLLLALAALPMMLIGARIGNLLAGRIDQHVFNVSVALVLTVSGTALLFK